MNSVETLRTVLLDSEPERLRELSESGVLGRIIPEWNRLTGLWNVQHSAHDFALDDHTIKVVERTRRSSYFQVLPDYHRWLAVISALLHDIEKNTGPARLVGKIPVDKLHPVKSAKTARYILQRLGFLEPSLQRVERLIHHHQAFGRLFVFYRDGAPVAAQRRLAAKIRSLDLMNCLLAVSEGDIRAVRRDDAIFTQPVADKLDEYAQTVADCIRHFRQGVPLLPQHAVVDPSNGQADRTKSRGFVLTAPAWETLAERLSGMREGGAFVLPYYASLATLPEVPDNHCGILIAVSPENLAYCGPNPGVPEGVPVSMALFYALLLREPFKPEEPLAEPEAAYFNWLNRCRVDLENELDALAQTFGVDSWPALSLETEARLFLADTPGGDASDREQAVLDACLNLLREQRPDASFIGLATRPMQVGWFGPTQPPSQVTGLF